MEWDSPWGTWVSPAGISNARPCRPATWAISSISTAAAKIISTVHHTNEIAQTEACYGTRLANFWMHGYFLQLDEARWPNPAGNFLRVQTLIDKGYDPLAYRFFCLSALLPRQAQLHLGRPGRCRRQIARPPAQTVYATGASPAAWTKSYMEQFAEQINDDLNMPRALAVTWELARSDLPVRPRKPPCWYLTRCWACVWPNGNRARKRSRRKSWRWWTSASGTRRETLGGRR